MAQDQMVQGVKRASQLGEIWASLFEGGRRILMLLCRNVVNEWCLMVAVVLSKIKNFLLH
jgi:hypothetical protein